MGLKSIDRLEIIEIKIMKQLDLLKNYSAESYKNHEHELIFSELLFDVSVIKNLKRVNPDEFVDDLIACIERKFELEKRLRLKSWVR